jgi:hypothetical protein
VITSRRWGCGGVSWLIAERLTRHGSGGGDTLSARPRAPGAPSLSRVVRRSKSLRERPSEETNEPFCTD